MRRVGGGKNFHSWDWDIFRQLKAKTTIRIFLLASDWIEAKMLFNDENLDDGTKSYLFFQRQRRASGEEGGGAERQEQKALLLLLYAFAISVKQAFSYFLPSAPLSFFSANRI